MFIILNISQKEADFFRKGLKMAHKEECVDRVTNGTHKHLSKKYFLTTTNDNIINLYCYRYAVGIKDEELFKQVRRILIKVIKEEKEKKGLTNTYVYYKDIYHKLNPIINRIKKEYLILPANKRKYK